MRRVALSFFTCTLCLTVISGCATIRGWFGGKKSDPYADAYNQDIAAPAGGNAYPAYEPLPASTFAGNANAYPSGAGERYHTVAKKETLYSISRMYYNGDHTKWREIYEANRADISDPNRIRVGQRLVIP